MTVPRHLISTSSAVLMVVALTPVAHAATTARTPPVIVAVEPASGPTKSYFDVQVRRGARVALGRLVLRNRTAQRITVLLDRVDAVTATTLGSAYKVRGLKIHGPTRWTRLPARRVVLTAHAQRAVQIAVRVPRRAKPGDYLSGIGVQARVKPAKRKVRTNVAISSVQRYVVGVEVRVPGRRRPNIVLDRARAQRQPSGLVFLVHGRNRGNVILQNVTGSITVTRDGRRITRVPVLPGTFVTGTAIEFPAPARREQPKQGTAYRVRAVMRYAGGVARLDQLVRFGKRAAQAQQDFGGPKAASSGSGTNTTLIAAIAVLALGGWLVALLLIFRRRRRPEPGATH